MIKLFRKIRQKLLVEGKTSQYLKYAIGEIILVVIGIFIALQLNNWNQNRIDNLQATEALYNLKTELQKNIVDLETLDSLYATFQSSTKKGIEMLNNNLSVRDLIALDTLIRSNYTTFPLTKSTYQELINTGSFYNIKNEKLKSEINKLYLEGERRTSAFLEINSNTQQLMLNPDLFNYHYLVDQLKSERPNMRTLDTLWIQNKNSPTFLALYNKARLTQLASNTGRINLIKRHIIISKNLILSIENELKKETNNTVK